MAAQGVCTSWLAGLAAGQQVGVWVVRGAIHLPPAPAVPLLLVGPGTGVAPFRGFLHHRCHLARTAAAGASHWAHTVMSVAELPSFQRNGKRKVKPRWFVLCNIFLELSRSFC